jgi:predicted DNA binding CopG/RHH family protein
MAIEDPKFILKSYDDENLPDMITDAFTLIKNNMDRRFNFFISPDLLEYVKSQSRTRGVTQSAFIRDLIISHKHGRVQE